MTEFAATSAKPAVLKKPDRAEHDRQCNAITAEINALHEKAREAKNALDKLLNDRSGSKGEVEAARQAMQSLIAERKQMMAERNELTAQRDASRDKLVAYQNQEKAMRAEMKFSSIEAIDNQIRELEQRQARTTMSLNDEKKIIKDIKTLQQSKRTVATIAELKENMEREKTTRSVFDKKITDKNIELKDVNDRITAQRNVLDALNKDSADRDAVPNLRKAQLECREQIQEKFNAVRALKAEFKKSEDVYYAHLAEVNAKKREARQKELEAKAAEEDARRKQLEAEELARIPYEDEMHLCDHLISYLKTNFAADKDSSEASGTDAAPALQTAFAGMKLLSRDEQDYATLGTKKNRGKKKGGNNTKKDAIVHSMDTLDSFSLLQVAPPSSVAQVSTTIDALTQKKATFQGLARGAVPTIAETLKARQEGKPSGGAKGSRGGFSLEADFPTLAPNGAVRADGEVDA